VVWCGLMWWCCGPAPDPSSSFGSSSRYPPNSPSPMLVVTQLRIWMSNPWALAWYMSVIHIQIGWHKEWGTGNGWGEGSGLIIHNGCTRVVYVTQICLTILIDHVFGDCRLNVHRCVYIFVCLFICLFVCLAAVCASWLCNCPSEPLSTH